jgi:hypothetical protein
MDFITFFDLLHRLKSITSQKERPFGKAITPTVLQRSPRRLKRVLVGDVAGVPYVLFRELKDRGQLTHIVPRAASRCHRESDLAHHRIMQASGRRAPTTKRAFTTPHEPAQQNHSIFE